MQVLPKAVQDVLPSIYSEQTVNGTSWNIDWPSETALARLALSISMVAMAYYFGPLGVLPLIPLSVPASMETLGGSVFYQGVYYLFVEGAKVNHIGVSILGVLMMWQGYRCLDEYETLFDHRGSSLFGSWNGILEEERRL